MNDIMEVLRLTVTEAEAGDATPPKTAASAKNPWQKGCNRGLEPREERTTV